MLNITYSILALLLLLIAGCNPYYLSGPPCDLVAISLVDQDGISTTIQTPERLLRYSHVDFLTPQTYQKVMCIYHRDENGDIPASITSYYPTGQVKQYLDVLNARALGDYREWHENGILKLECSVVGGLGDLTDEAIKTWNFDGTAQSWDDCGKLLAAVQYEKGSLEGASFYYYPNGQVRRQATFRRNLAEGLEESFDTCGQLIEISTFVKGVKEGRSARYWSDGRLAAEETYRQGNLIDGRYLTNSGELISTLSEGKGFRALYDEVAVRQLVEYRNGIPEGEVKLLERDGRLSTLFHVKNDKRHGEEILYYPYAPGSGIAPRPRISLTWYEDKIHGLVKTWYENGSMESQRELTNNLRNGLATAWYRDGGVMLMEEYDHDKLVKGEYFKSGERHAESRVTDGNGVATLYDGHGNLVHKVHYYHGYVLD